MSPQRGLDPGERNRFHNLLADVGKQVIILLSTHIVDDVRELCSKFAVMNQGEIVYHGTPQDAISELKGKVWQKHIEREELDAHQNSFQVISDKMIAGKPVIHAFAESNPDNGFKLVEPSLEDVFFVKTKLNLVTETL